ncbi:MAG: response regulator transcription factor [Bdellovibrionota bacterium]
MKNIMIVEDDDDIREVLSCVLEDEGFSVTSFESVAGAFESLKSQTKAPDLILLDFMFPTGNSADFLASIRDQFKSVPVVLMSAGNDVIVGGSAGRANGFISKPIQIESLLGEIQKHCSAVSRS